MEISIIIPTKDRKDILSKTLGNACVAMAGTEGEIIVINDSKTTSVEIPPLYKDKVSVFNNPVSGVASARNLGASKAKADLLLFLDDDMLISQENIRTTLQLHQAYKNCCINLNWIYPPELTDKISETQFGRYLIHYGFTSLKGWNRGEYWNDRQLFKVNGITSQYLSMEKKVFIKAGGYNETFPHAGFEDYEFAQRLKQQEIDFYIYPLSMVYHNEEDRLQVEAWLQRKKRGGETRRVAVEMGFKQVALSYSFAKSTTLKCITLCSPFLILLAALVPNIQFLDIIYFKIINILLAAVIFEGYTFKD